MTQRPSVAPSVVASIVEQAPGRVRRKLDKQSNVANDWTWTRQGDGWTVEAGGESVRLEAPDGQVSIEEHVKCSCLLSPRCFHAIACLSVLPIEDAPDEDASPSDTTSADQDALETSEANTSTATPIGDAERTAAAQMWKDAAGVLAAGARASGSLLQAHLLRAVHECRCQGLHRLAASGLRIVQSIKQLREQRPEFRSDSLVADLHELLMVAWEIQRAENSIGREWVGVARRRFEPIRSLRLTGLLSEPLLTRSGYAGVVTYLMGDDGVMCSVSDVRPGSASRIREAWKTGVDMGGMTISHAELNRQGVLIQNATRSADGRLGGGESARAVTTKGEGWQSPSVAGQFEVPLQEQIERVFRWADVPDLERPAGFDFVYLKGVVAGACGADLLLRLEGSFVRLRIAADSDATLFRDNLTLLARAPGLRLRCVARMDPQSAGEAIALAVAPDTTSALDADDTNGDADQDQDQGRPEFDLPDKFKGHVNLGLDQLERGHLSTANRSPFEVDVSRDEALEDGLDALRRRLRSLAMGGRHSLPTGSLRDVTRDARRLQKSTQPTAAGLLLTLAKSAIESDTSFTGVRFPSDPSPLAEKWLATARYEHIATRTIQKHGWLKNV